MMQIPARKPKKTDKKRGRGRLDASFNKRWSRFMGVRKVRGVDDAEGSPDVISMAIGGITQVKALMFNLPQVWKLREGLSNGRLASSQFQGRQLFHDDVVGAFN